MGNLVQELWDRFDADGHFNGYRLALHHPKHGLLITEDIEWFVVRRVAFIPETDLEQLAAGSPLPSREMLFHISEHDIWYPFQISDHLPLADPSSQVALVERADQWAATVAAQNWLNQASKYPSDLAATIKTHPQWQPDGAIVDRWLVTDPNMEAFDGCKIAHSSTCEHGFQSWAKEMGYTP